MADISAALVTYLLDQSSITDVIGDRIESGSLSQGVAVPAITYRRISTTHTHTIQGAKGGIAFSRIEINSFGATRLQADQLAELIRLSGILNLQRTAIGSVVVAGVVIDSGIRQDEIGPDEGSHERRYVASQDYQFAFYEAV